MQGDVRPRDQESAREPQSGRRRTSQETRRAVLAAARRLFFTKGFDQTTLMDLGEETGLSARGVILHFETKADIIATLYIRDYTAREAPRGGTSAGIDACPAHPGFLFLDGARGCRQLHRVSALWSVSAKWSPPSRLKWMPRCAGCAAGCQELPARDMAAGWS